MIAEPYGIGSDIFLIPVHARQHVTQAGHEKGDQSLWRPG